MLAVVEVVIVIEMVIVMVEVVDLGISARCSLFPFLIRLEELMWL